MFVCWFSFCISLFYCSQWEYYEKILKIVWIVEIGWFFFGVSWNVHVDKWIQDVWILSWFEFSFDFDARINDHKPKQSTTTIIYPLIRFVFLSLSFQLDCILTLIWANIDRVLFKFLTVVFFVSFIWDLNVEFDIFFFSVTKLTIQWNCSNYSYDMNRFKDMSIDSKSTIYSNWIRIKNKKVSSNKKEI